MAESAGTVQNGFVLRFSVPASGEMAAVGPELAVKLAEQLGAPPEGAAQVGAALSDLARQVDPSGTADVLFEFHKLERELKIEARHASRVSETRVSLRA